MPIRAPSDPTRGRNLPTAVLQSQKAPRSALGQKAKKLGVDF